jgi:hypothetical protein
LLTKRGQGFTLGLDEQGRRELIEVLTRQPEFSDILLALLFDRNKPPQLVRMVVVPERADETPHQSGSPIRTKAAQ